MRKMLMALGGAAAVVASALGVAAGPAGATVLARWDVAQKRVPLTQAPFDVAGPVLAGDRVVWARGEAHRSWTIEAAPGGVLARLPKPAPVPGRFGLMHVLALAGSPTRLAYEEWTGSFGDRYSSTRGAAGWWPQGRRTACRRS